jgi:hypothetical protein
LNKQKYLFSQMEKRKVKQVLFGDWFQRVEEDIRKEYRE